MLAACQRRQYVFVNISSHDLWVITMDETTFIGRFLQHVILNGFKRIRHCGLLAPAAKKARLQIARQLLEMPVANPRAQEDAQDFMLRIAQHQPSIFAPLGPHNGRPISWLKPTIRYTPSPSGGSVQRCSLGRME